MTLTKESLREALTEFDAWEDGSVNSLNDLPLVQAARFVERLLPECELVGHPNHLIRDCEQIWDEGLVEVVAQAMAPWERLDDVSRNIWRGNARAVLAALTQEVGRG